ncbi:MAG: GspE/PulE family protein [bacterium]
MDSELILDVFVQNDELTEEQKDAVLGTIQTETEISAEDVFAEITREGNFRNERDVVETFAEHYGMDFIDLENRETKGELIDELQASSARQYFVFPIERTSEGIKLAVAEPPDVRVVDDLEALLDERVEFCLAPPEQIRSRIDEFYGMSLDEVTETLEEVDEDAVQNESLDDSEQDVSNLEEQAEEGSIIRLVNMLILEGVQRGASDIHIEPLENKIVVRYRIDGILHEAHEPPKNLQGAIISRIKIMSDMSIAEWRVPQDGRINMKIMGKRLDLRVSTLPSIHGESVVLRILDKESVSFGLEDLGFLPDNKAVFDQLIERPHGIILVTGPTGSGKTTTLYSALNEINDKGIKLITIEDPVEYQIEGINQMQVNEDIGLDFAEGLKTLMRQNPDVILVGEIRDYETAETAIRASLTGHLVFSTLHTNDAPSTVNRLIDLGVNPYLIGSSVQAIMAQRLVRNICDNCKEEYRPEENYLKQVGFPLEDAGDTRFYRGSGCDNCEGTGYSGRTAIFELLVNTEDISEAILNDASTSEIRDLAMDNGMRTLRQDGFIKVRMGETTLMEVARVTQAHGTVAAI